MKNSNTKLIEMFYHDLWNNFNKLLIPEILDNNLKFRGSLGDIKHGHTGFTDYVNQVKNFSADFHNEILEIITEDNKSFVKLKFSGTHSGEIFDIKATQKKFIYHGAAVFKFNNELITEIWVLGDLLNLIKQLK